MLAMQICRRSIMSGFHGTRDINNALKACNFNKFVLYVDYTTYVLQVGIIIRTPMDIY